MWGGRVQAPSPQAQGGSYVSMNLSQKIGSIKQVKYELRSRVEIMVLSGLVDQAQMMYDQ